jgi:S-adenosylmethionine decarboxylase proenzyme
MQQHFPEQPLAHHVLLDLYGCDKQLLDDEDFLHDLFLKTAEELRCTLIKDVFHRFSPQGVSGVLVIAESHLSIHTWPELGYASIDLFTCSDPSELRRMPEILASALAAERFDFQDHARGILRPQVTGHPTQKAFVE